MSGSTLTSADISHLFGNDVDETADGDIAIATAATLTEQRVIRRLLSMKTTSAVSNYPWQPSYGADLPEDVGEPLKPRGVTGTILAQMKQEASVAQSPAPTVSIDTSNAASGVYPISVTYQDTSGNLQNFNFDYIQ